MRNWEGERIKQYVVEARIGVGAQSEVYQARHQESNELFALKFWSSTIPRGQLLDSIARTRQLHHPHIIKIIDVGVHEPTVYMIMQLAKGGTLDDLFTQNRATKLVDSLQVLTEIAQALDFLHQNRVVHRDLKPSNILLDDRGHGYLSDFGLANFMESSPEMILDPQEDLRGTITYMAPEIWLGEEIGPWTDIYALALITYQTLSGQPPFVAEKQLGISYAHVYTALPHISKAIPQIPKAVDQVIARAAAKDPQARYPSAVQFMEDLYQAIEPWLDQHQSTDLKKALHQQPDHYLFNSLLETVATNSAPQIPGYTILRPLTDAQKGGMADLYLARRDIRPPDERYVIKIPRIKVDGPGGDAIYAQFKHEIELLSNLDHVAIIQIVDYGECEVKENRRPFFVTPYMVGRDLRDKLNKGKLLTLTEAAALLQRLGEALDYAYQKNGTIHLDIKPDNLLFNKRGEMVLSDFGLGYNENLTLVESFMFAGTIQYCSPDQLTKRRDKLDQRADVYAAGVLLFEILSGQRPFARSAPEEELAPVAQNKRKYEVIQAHLFTPVPSIFDLAPTLREHAPEIQVVLQKAMAKKAEDRFASVTQLALAVKAILPPAIPQIGSETSLVGTYPHYRLYQAKWRGRQIVVQLFKDASGSPAVQQAFSQHTNQLYRLDKSHIAFVHAEGFDAHQRPYLIWDNPGGNSLASRLQARGRLSLGESKGIIRSVAQAVDHAHEQGLAHLNIRPETILLDAAAKPALIAFDLLIPDNKANSHALLDAYSSPEEQAKQVPTRRTDVYYVGRTLAAMLNGAAALPNTKNETAASLPARQVLGKIEQLISHYRVGLNPGVQRVINRATAQDPGERYRSATELSQELDKVPSYNPLMLISLLALLLFCMALFFICSAFIPGWFPTEAASTSVAANVTTNITTTPTVTPTSTNTSSISVADMTTPTIAPSPSLSPTPTVTATPPPTPTSTWTQTPTPTPTETATEIPTITPTSAGFYVTLLKPVNCDNQAPSDKIFFEFRSSRTINTAGNNSLSIIIFRRGTNTEVDRLSLDSQQFFAHNNLWQVNIEVSRFFRTDTHDYQWQVFYNGSAISPRGCFRYVPTNSTSGSNGAVDRP